MSNPHRIELRKIPIEQRIIDLQIKAWSAEKTIGELQGMIKAQAGWINKLDDRIGHMAREMDIQALQITAMQDRIDKQEGKK